MHREENEFFARTTSACHYELKSFIPWSPSFRNMAVVEAKKEFDYKPHRHPLFEIIIPLAGRYECVLNGAAVALAPEGLLVVQEGDTHQDFFRPGLRFAALSFALEPRGPMAGERRFFRRDVTPALQVAPTPMDAGMRETLSMMERLPECDIPSAFYVLDGLCRAFFWQALGLFGPEALAEDFVENSLKEEFRNRLAALFEANASNRLDVAFLAKEMRMSPSSLTHKCKALLGEPPAKAFMRYKLNSAAAMLRRGDMSVKEVGESLGFSDQFHFSKSFKQAFGESPSTVAHNG